MTSPLFQFSKEQKLPSKTDHTLTEAAESPFTGTVKAFEIVRVVGIRQNNNMKLELRLSRRKNTPP